MMRPTGRRHAAAPEALGIRRLSAALLAALGLLTSACEDEPALAEPPPPQAETRIGPSGLPVPRFMSLKFDEVRGREGPSREHRVLWVYRQKGLPVEVIEEDQDWRKIRDPDGDVAWVHARLLESRRMGVVKGAAVRVRRRPELHAPVVAEAEHGVLFEIEDCRDGWMRVDGARAAGWAPEGALWGAGCG